jgi:thiamine biosynthesis lipoprotein ApbE
MKSSALFLSLMHRFNLLDAGIEVERPRERQWRPVQMLKQGLDRFVKAIATSSEPDIWQTHDRDGAIVWHTYDPSNGQSHLFASEDEVRVWLEKRYSQ